MEDLLNHHDRHRKRSDTNIETVPVLILREYRMTEKGCQIIRFEAKTNCCIKIYMLSGHMTNNKQCFSCECCQAHKEAGFVKNALLSLSAHCTLMQLAHVWSRSHLDDIITWDVLQVLGCRPLI